MNDFVCIRNYTEDEVYGGRGFVLHPGHIVKLAPAQAEQVLADFPHLVEEVTVDEELHEKHLLKEPFTLNAAVADEGDEPATKEEAKQEAGKAEAEQTDDSA